MLRALSDVVTCARADGAARDAIVVLIARAPDPVGPEDLLRAEIPGARVFWDPTRAEREHDRVALCGRGETVRLELSGPARLVELRAQAQALFARLDVRRGTGCENAPATRLVGGIAFRAKAGDGGDAWQGFGDASFALPRWTLVRGDGATFVQLAVRGEELAAAEIAREVEAVGAALAVAPTRAGTADVRADAFALRDEMGAARWTMLVGDALLRIDAGELDKVVAARRSCVRIDAPLDVATVLARMAVAQPRCARFAIERGDGVFLGASPEWLVEKRAARATADALAGTRTRGGDAPEADAAALLASDKDRREHALVVDAVASALGTLGAAAATEPTPRVRVLRHLVHLYTPVTADLPADVHALDLVAALHPTPAVCGLPKTAADAWITRSEPVGRGWYAAPVGWFDAAGDGAFVVAIRSAVVRRERAWLYAGAGIVRGSDPAAEFAEAGVKQLPMLQALGVVP